MKALREKHLAQVADNLSYFNDCKTSFVISECKSWINKIFDDVEALQQRSCDGCKYGKEEEEEEIECEDTKYFCTPTNMSFKYYPPYNFYCNRYEAKPLS